MCRIRQRFNKWWNQLEFDFYLPLISVAVRTGIYFASDGLSF